MHGLTAQRTHPNLLYLIINVFHIRRQTCKVHIHAPCIFYNLNGYYDDLESFFEHMIDCGLSTPERQRRIHFARSLEEIGTLICA